MIAIEGGSVLIDGRFVETPVSTQDDRIAGLIPAGRAAKVLDATGCLVLPGIVDIHGDAFERQVMPRPGVFFPLETALVDTDRQLVANGITTALHGLTWSWEPGLRGPQAARDMVSGVERMRPVLAADTLIHLRQETFNLEAEGEIVAWLADRRVAALAFNDHMVTTIRDRDRPLKVARMVERAGVSVEDFWSITMAAYDRAPEVPDSIRRLAAAARDAGVPLLSHDDASAEDRRWYRDLGAAIAEFPTTEAVAADAAKAGDAIVFGAPNVVRGGSHTGCPSASDMVSQGLCTILASDYYYPAPATAAFRLAQDGIRPLEQAWDLISLNPARALGLDDRGAIAPGLRADLVLAKATGAGIAIVATIARGALVHLADGRLLKN